MGEKYTLVDLAMPMLSYALKVKSVLTSNKKQLDPAFIFEDLTKMIELTKIKVMPNDEKRFDDMLFAVAVFIDEQFLQITQNGFNLAWQKNSLQKIFFMTNNGGVIFFSKLNEIYEDKELRDIYEYCLALGFKGVYYNDYDTQKLEQIKNHNLENLNLKLPVYLFSEAYSKDIFEKKEPIRLLGVVNGLIFAIPLIIVIAVYIMLDMRLDYVFQSIVGASK